MKTIKTATLFAAICMMISTSVSAQEKTASKEKTLKQVQSEKKVNVTETNGEKTVKVETTENGVTKKETYKGAEADAYLKKEEKTAKDNPNIERKVIRKEEEKTVKKKESKTK